METSRLTTTSDLKLFDNASIEDKEMIIRYLKTKISDYILDKNEKEMVLDGFIAVTIAGGWTFLANYNCESFMFSDKSSKLEEIYDNIKYDLHSGASHALTMRILEYIAKHGIEDYINSLRNEFI